MDSNVNGGVWRHWLKGFLFVMLLGGLSFRKKLSKIWTDFWITMKVVEIFDEKFEELWAVFGISREYECLLRKALLTQLMGDDSGGIHSEC